MLASATSSVPSRDWRSWRWHGPAPRSPVDMEAMPPWAWGLPRWASPQDCRSGPPHGSEYESRRFCRADSQAGVSNEGGCWVEPSAGVGSCVGSCVGSGVSAEQRKPSERQGQVHGGPTRPVQQEQAALCLDF